MDDIVKTPGKSDALPLLDVKNLTVEFATRRGTVRAVKNVDLTLAKGETLAIVGESGSGKSVTSYAVMRILDRAGRIAEGTVSFSGLDLIATPENEMRGLRGREMSMIFQSPRLALNPIRKVGRQIEDVLLQHAQVDTDDVTERAIDVLNQVRIARPRERYHAYPFELSGGMCQRVVIALALACRPQLLIADEPTKGGDGLGRRTDARTRHVDHSDHPRSRPCRRLLRPGDGDGKGQCGRDGDVVDDFHQAIASLYAQIDAGDAAAWRQPARFIAGRGRRARRCGAGQGAGICRESNRGIAAAGGRQTGQGISTAGRRDVPDEYVFQEAGGGGHRHVPRRRWHQL
jgi:ABC-type dipeptide/oligopeptide/nickel transport system ATPase subunit